MAAKSLRMLCCWRRVCNTGSWGFRDADRLTGRGIYYGAALVEATSCKDEEVFVVGGANSAGQAALHFAKFARKVTDAGARKGLVGHHVEILNR